MDTEQVLLGAIRADPSDHAARLALADWLEESGRAEQAELLRLHVRQMTKEGLVRELWRLGVLLGAGVRPVVPLVVNSIGMRLALIPPGTFFMGSDEGDEDRCSDEAPCREVAITRPFYLGVFPVTQTEYERVTGANPSTFCPAGGARQLVRGLDTSDFPVEQVTWGEAAAFCERLSNLPDEQSEGRSYRLPTEAEWEYACRGGNRWSLPYHFGLALPQEAANFNEHLGRTRKAGEPGRPNAFGLHDMHGNVWEWCADWYGRDYSKHGPRDDPPGPADGEGRVMRGGSWYTPAARCRSASRHRLAPTEHSTDLGFRVAMVTAGGRGRPEQRRDKT